MTRLVCLLFALVAATFPVFAHEIRPSYLQVDETAPGRYSILWRKPVLSGVPIPVEVRLPGDVHDVTPPAVQVLPDSIVERRLVDTGPAGLAGKVVEFEGLQATLTDVLVRAAFLDGSETTTLVRPPEGRVVLGNDDPWPTVFAKFLRTGVRHILTGPDHLLFILGLMALVGSRRALFGTITAFTVAHSITLAIATLGYVRPPVAPIEAAIALSILFVAPEMIRRLNGGDSLAIRKPWVIAFAFGLLHGIGFAGGLSVAGLATADVPLALLSFNVGVEIGQLAFVSLILLAAAAARMLRVRWPAAVRLAPAYAVGALGAFWTIERVASAFGAA